MTDNKTYPFKLYFSMQKTFNKDMGDIIKELNISKEIPDFMQGMDLKPGVYSYGVASTPTKDADGEKVIISDEVLAAVKDSAYNKIFHSHDNKDISTGTVEFLGRVSQMEDEIILVERMNEYHPLFRNFAGSINNDNLTHYSVGGDATVAYDPSDGSTIRTVKRLNEISRTSNPGNEEASISGLFFVKSKNGGYAYKPLEGTQMENELLEKLTKQMEDFAKRLDGIEKFQKDAADDADKTDDEKAKDKADADAKAAADKAEADKKNIKKDADTDDDKKAAEDKAKADKEAADKAANDKPSEDTEEVKKMKARLEKLEKVVSKVEKSKAFTKEEKLEKTKTSGNEIIDFLKDGNRKSLVPGGL